MTTVNDRREQREHVQRLFAEPWRVTEDARLVYMLEDFTALDGVTPLRRNRFGIRISHDSGSSTSQELDALARLVLALPDLLACAQRYGEASDPLNGDRHCIECGAVGDPDPAETMTHERGCMLGEALSLALGSDLHDEAKREPNRGA